MIVQGPAEREGGYHTDRHDASVEERPYRGGARSRWAKPYECGPGGDRGRRVRILPRMRTLPFAPIVLSLALLVVACDVPVVADDAAQVAGIVAPGGEPTACELWPTLSPPEDFDATCRPAGEDLLALEGAMFAMINADRAEHAAEANGAAPLEYDCMVAQVARLHSYEMCQQAALEHVLDGRDLVGRLADRLEWQIGEEYVLSAENISWYPDLQAAEDAFVEEEPPCDAEVGGHRLNILDRDLRYVGVGHCQCAGDPFGNFYLTQDFVTYSSAHVSGTNPYCGF